MEEITEYRQELLAKLAGESAELHRIAAKIPSNAWRVFVAPGKHTPHYILVHLVELDTPLFVDQIHSIYDKNVPVLPQEDDRWMAEHYDSEKPVQELLDVFSRSLEQEAGWLGGLSPEEWSRAARHPGWGVRTLQWWVERQLSIYERHLEALAAFAGA